jgi:hypothetical protein
MMKTLIARCIVGSVLLTTFTLTSRAQNRATKLGTNSVKEVIAAMSLEEKVLLLIGMRFNLDIRGVKNQ